MRIGVFGGTGYIGRAFVAELVSAGHEVVLFARPRPGRGVQPPPIDVVDFDGEPHGAWRARVDGLDAVVGMTGATIGKRWTRARKRRIYDSRILVTRTIVDAIRAASDPPAVFVSASGTGIYGDRGGDLLAEDEPPGDDWLARLAADWEAEAVRAEETGVRVVCVRTAVVFGPGGGSLPQLTLPFRLFVGGPVGGLFRFGTQWFPWVSLDDVAGIYRFAVEHQDVRGPLNACAGSVRERDLARLIGRVLRRPSLVPAPTFALRLVLGELGPELVVSERVSNTKLLEFGYRMRRPDLEQTLRWSLGR